MVGKMVEEMIVIGIFCVVGECGMRIRVRKKEFVGVIVGFLV